MFQKLLLLSILSLTATTLFAQETSELLSPFARGAGGTYSTSARGLDAIGLNPALLGLGAPRPFELQILPVASFGINAGPTLVHLNSIGTGFQDTNLSSIASTSSGIGTIGDSTRAAIVDYIRGNNLSSSFSSRLFALSFSDADIGTFALSWTLNVALRAYLPDSLLLYMGRDAVPNIASQAVLGPTSVDVQGLAYSAYTLSYSRTILGRPSTSDLQLRAGIGLKYLAGIEMMRVDPTSTFAINDPQPPGGSSALVAVNYKMRFSYPNDFGTNGLPNGFSLGFLTAGSAGSGFGADIGFTLGQFDSAGYSPWQASLSLTDLGSITWTKHTDIRSANDTLIVSFGGSLDTLNSKLSAAAGRLDTTDAPFTTKLPTTLHMGASLDLASIGIEISGFHMLAALEFALGLTDAVGAPNHGRFGAAAMLIKPSKGFSYHTALGMSTQDGIVDASFALGIGIGNSFQLDLGTARLFGLFSSNSNKDGSISMKFLF